MDTETLDIELIDLSTEMLLLVAPKGAHKLSKALFGVPETGELLDCPNKAWDTKCALEVETKSSWVIWDISSGLDCTAVLGTRAEFEQYFADWL